MSQRDCLGAGCRDKNGSRHSTGVPLKPIRKAGRGGTQVATTDQPVNTTSFIPFGKDYRGGVSLATGWLAGSLGGAKRIVVSQLADSGSVKIFSSGSALDGGPSLYLQSPLHHDHSAPSRLPAVPGRPSPTDQMVLAKTTTDTKSGTRKLNCMLGCLLGSDPWAKRRETRTRRHTIANYKD